MASRGMPYIYCSRYARSHNECQYFALYLQSYFHTKKGKVNRYILCLILQYLDQR